MPQLFRLNNDKNNKSWRTLSLDADRLRLINARHDTEEAFDAAFEKGGLFKSKLDVPVSDVTRLAHPENAPTTLRVTHGDKTSVLEFDKEADLRIVTEQLQTAHGFGARTDKVGGWRAVGAPILGLFIFAIFGFILYDDAETVRNGDEIKITGRRRGIQLLLRWIAETLGYTGTVILLLVIGAALLWFLYKRISQPPSEVVYE